MFANWSKRIVQKTIESHLVQRCVVQRYEDAIGDYGEPVRGLVFSAEYDCYLTAEQNTPPNMVVEADRGVVYYKLSLPFDADIQDGDSVVIGDIGYETRQVITRQSQDVMLTARLIRSSS